MRIGSGLYHRVGHLIEIVYRYRKDTQQGGMTMSTNMPRADLLKRAIKLQKAISDRSEDQKLEDHPYLFVDNPRQNVATAMAGNANQVLFGRRGTGKTMLLRKLLRDGHPCNTSSDYIAIMIQAPDFLRSPDVTQKDPPVVRARCYFREFLHQVADKLISICDAILRDEDFLARLGLKNRNKRDVLIGRFLSLSHTLQYGVRLNRLDSATFNEHIEDYGQRERAGGHEAQLGIGTGASASEKGASAGIAMGSAISGWNRGEHAQRQTVVVKEDFTGDYDFGIPEIRAKLRDILEMVQTKHVLVLLDEWQALSLDCQAEFAELLNRCFFGIDCVSVKIAAYRHVCQFNNGGARGNFRGLELGQDIAVAGDTDLPPAEDNTKKFFFDILYRRLLYKEPLLERHYGRPSEFDYGGLVRDVFHNTHAAEMLVRGCHGISRDFIKVFNLSTGYLDDDVARGKITLDVVNKAHGENSREVQANVHTADDIGGLLFEIVKPHAHRTGAPYFFLPQTNRQWDSLLWELVEKRAIHVVPPDSLPPGADVEWRGYEVSYGLFEEWRRAEVFAGKGKGGHMQWTDVASLAREEFESHVLKIENDPGAIRVCGNCKQQFSTTCHPFIVARRCPSCYAEQTE